MSHFKFAASVILVTSLLLCFPIVCDGDTGGLRTELAATITSETVTISDIAVPLGSIGASVVAEDGFDQMDRITAETLLHIKVDDPGATYLQHLMD